MRRSVFLLTLLLLVLFSSNTPAQTPPPPKDAPSTAAAAAAPCPKIEIQFPSGRIIRDGQAVVFAANIAGGDGNVTPTIVWSTSAGMIRSGQGTRSIEVDSTGAGADRQIVADLWVGGYAPECVTQATAAVRVAGPATKVDEFGELAPDAEIERLNNVGSAASQANDNVYVIAYAGRTNVRGYASTSLKRIKEHLVKAGVTNNRISTVDGGFREQSAFELWIVPAGAESPKPTPTVDRKEIVYPKPTPPVRKP